MVVDLNDNNSVDKDQGVSAVGALTPRGHDTGCYFGMRGANRKPCLTCVTTFFSVYAQVGLLMFQPGIPAILFLPSSPSAISAH